MVAQVARRRIDVLDTPATAPGEIGQQANPLVEAKIAFVGAGVMAEAMIAGLLNKALIPPWHIVASHPREDRRQKLRQRFGICSTESNLGAASGSDLVILTIKP